MVAASAALINTAAYAAGSINTAGDNSRVTCQTQDVKGFVERLSADEVFRGNGLLRYLGSFSACMISFDAQVIVGSSRGRPLRMHYKFNVSTKVDSGRPSGCFAWSRPSIPSVAGHICFK